VTNEQTGMMVFQDRAGKNYLTPLESPQQRRVSQERKTEVERLMASAPGGDDATTCRDITTGSR